MSHKSKKKTVETSSHLGYNDLYRVLFEQATDGIFIADEQGYYIDVNQHGCEMLGYARDEMLNFAMKDLIPNEDLEHDPLQLDKLQASKSLLRERRLRCKDGRLLSVEISAQMLTDGNYLGIVRDISKRKQAEEELRKREHEFRTLTEHFPDTVARFDREGCYLYVNSSVEKVSGIPVEELIGQRYGEKLAERQDSVVSEETLSLRQAIKQVFITGDPFETEIKVTLSTGEYFRNVRLFPEFNEAKQVASVLYISRDITEQKQAEEALRNVLHHSRTIVMHADVTVPEGWDQHPPEWSAPYYHWKSRFEDEVSCQQVLPVVVLPGENYAYGWGRAKHRDDLEPMALRAARAFVSGDTSWHQEFRAIDRYGRLHWFAQVASLEVLEHGRWRVTTINTDITERKRAEEALRESEKQFRLLAENSTDMISRHSPDGVYLYASPASMTLLGYEPDELVGHSAYELFHPADIAIIKQSHTTILDQPVVYTTQYRIRRKDGQYIWFETTSRTIRDSQSEAVIEIHASSRDITERKQLENELRRAHQNYASLVNSVDGIVWEADAQSFQFNFVSQQAERLLGYPVENWLSEPTFWKDHIHPDDQQWAVDFCIKSTLEKRTHDFEYRMLASDGRAIWLHDIVTVMVENDQAVRLRGLMVDITERKQMEEERRASEARFRAFVDHATDALFFHEWGTILDVNLQACVSLGYSREELLGMTPHDFDVDLEQDFLDQIEAGLNAGEVITFETRHRRKDGIIFPVEVRVRGFVQGESHFAVSVARDITERKQTEARMRALIDAIPDMLVRHDREGRYLEIKATSSIPLNYAIPDAIGKTVSEMLPHDPQLAGHILRRIEKALDTSEMDVQEYELTFDGKTLYREARTIPINEHEVLMLIRDITVRKEAEAGLQRYNKRLSILHRIDKGILSAQSPKEIADTVLEQLAQLIPCEFLSVILHNDDLTEERIFALRHTPELGQYSQEIQPVVQNEVLETLKSGKTAIAPDLLQQAGSHARLALELESHGVRSALASPMIVHGKLIGTIALAAQEVGFFTSEHQQITEEVAAQIAIALHQAKLNDQLRQYNTELEQRVRERTMQLENANRELEMFSYSVSHDLRAPLRAIQGFAEIIARRHRASLNEEGRRYFDYIVMAGVQMDQLISDLLNYARLGRQQLHLEAISLQLILDTVLNNMQPLIDDVSAQIRLQDELPVIQGDQTLLIQIFTNLLQNALTYHRSGISPIIDVSWHLDDERATICIRDNGIGISPEFHEKIFDIFQRLHSPEQYPGTGIGLAIVKRSVDLLHGKVWLETVTQGSLFCVGLPHQVAQRKTT